MGGGDVVGAGRGGAPGLGRRDVLRLAAGSVLGLGASALLGACRPPGSGPGGGGSLRNVVCIVADDMRADELAYMPNVAAMAAQGTTFSTFRVPTPVCNPSRAMFLRGQLASGPNGTGIVSQATGLPESMRRDVLPAWLSAVGYRCGVLGKYLTAPVRPRLDEGWSTIGTAFGDSRANAYGYQLWDGIAVSDPVTDQRQEERLGDLAVDFLATSEGPFFLWYCSQSPHGPHEPLPEDLAAVAGVEWPYEAEDVSDKPSWIRARPEPTSSDVAYMRAFALLRLAELRELDRAVGRIWDQLAASGRLEDTVVLFWSDNADALLEHRLPYLGKGMPYDVCTRVPLVVAGAGVPAGQVLDVVTTGPDLTATVLSLARADATVPQDGVSLVDVAVRPQAHADRAMLGRCGTANAAVAGTPPSDWVATATRKLVRYEEPVGGFVDPTDRFELYDLVADPGELVNLAWDPAWLAERDALEARLDSLLATGTG